MQTTLEFPALLRLIDDRSAAFRAAVQAAPALDAQVPTCPDWKLLDLVRHLGRVHRFWAAVVAAGPADGPVDPSVTAAEADDSPAEREALLAWSAASTALLLDALRAAGPDGGCWTWWGTSQSPQTAGAVARHQVQEATVHTYDAQITADDAQPLPAESALDGVEEFLTTCCATTDAWPHDPAVIDFHATEGRSWRLFLSAEGARAERLESPEPTADAIHTSMRGTAGEVVLAFYNRIPFTSLDVGGDPRQLELLRDWEPA